MRKATYDKQRETKSNRRKKRKHNKKDTRGKRQTTKRMKDNQMAERKT